MAEVRGHVAHRERAADDRRGEDRVRGREARGDREGGDEGEAREEGFDDAYHEGKEKGE